MSPYPTNRNIYDLKYKPNAGTALLVGEQGLIMEYDGVYYNVVPSNITVNLWAVAWSPLGDYALIGGDNGALYKYQSGKLTKFYMGTTSNVRDIDFRPDMDKALIITDNAEVYVYTDLGLGGTIYFLGQFAPVYFTAVSWHPSDHTALLVGYEIVQNQNGWHWEGRVFQYDDNNAQFTNLAPNVPTDRDTDLYAVDWSPLGGQALIGGWNGYLLRWDGQQFGTVSMSTGNTFQGIEFNGFGVALLVGWFGEVYTYKNGNLVMVPSGITYMLYCVDWSSDNSMGLVAGELGTLATYDPSTNKITVITVGADTTFYDAAWKPDWSYALIVGSQGAVFKWDGVKLTKLASPTSENLLGIAWAPNGDRALMVGTNGALIEYFDGGTGGDPSMVQRLSGTTKNLWGVDFNNNGQALIVGDRGEVRTWTNNVATKLVSTNVNNMRSVDWKDASTAYATGDAGTVLRIQTSPVQRVDVSTPNLQFNNALWGGQWKDDKQRGLICGDLGLLMEHIDNSPLTTLDDSFNPIDTGTNALLYGMDWNYGETDVLMVGNGGTVANFHDDSSAVRLLRSPTTETLYGVSWKGNQYALIVGGSGTVMKYWPNLKPAAVVMNNPTEITDNSMKLVWSRSDVGDFHHYEVHMSKTAGFNPSGSTRLKTITDQDITSMTVTGLSRDTTYYFKVRIVDNGGLYADSNQVFGHTIVGKIPPSAVKLYDPTDITDSSMMLAWDQNKDTDFDHYELHMSKVKGFTPSGSTVKVTVDNQTVTITPVKALAVETTYYFKLRVVDKDGLTNDSNEVSGTTQKINVAPTAVKLNEPFNVTDDTMEVNWSMNKDSDFKSYEVHLGTQQGFTINASTLKATITAQNLTAYKFEGLTQLTNYYIKVRVVDTGGLYSDSNEVTAKTKEYNAAPIPVKLDDPYNVTESSMRLSWSKNNDTDFEKYEVHMANTANFVPNQSTMVDRISSQNVTTYKPTGLTPGMTYFIKVRVYDFAEQFADSNEVFAKTIGNEPPTPVVLNISSVEQNAVNLIWTKNNDTDFAKYEVYYSKDSGFTPDPASLAKTFTSSSARSARIDLLDTNTTYYFIVRVVDSLGAHSDSNLATATTLGPDLPPKAVVLGEPYNISRTYMELEWSLSPDRDFGYYELHKSEKAGFKPSDTTKVIKITDQNMTHYNITGLKMDTEYHFILRVYDQTQHDNDSNEVFAKTMPPNQPPIADAGSDINAFTGDTVDLKGIGIDPDGKIALYEWDFEGDGIYDYTNTLTGEITHQYVKAGIYMATLRVTDNEGETATDNTGVTISEPPAANKLPRANAGPDRTVTVDEVVTFDGTGTDDDGSIKLYEWDFNGDGNYDYSSDSDGTAEHTYPDEGTYKARLRVTDNLNATGTDVAIITVNPKNHAPKAVINKPLDGKKYNNIDPVQFDATGSSDQDGDLMTYKWIDESDGSRVLSTRLKFSTVMTKLGTHTITLEVSDGKDKGTTSIDITVAEPTNKLPTISISDPVRGATVKGTVVIDGRASDEDGTVAEVCIKIDGGACQKATGKTDWSYEWNTANVEAGLHTIKAQVTDDRGDTTDTSITVTVQGKKTGSHGFLGLPGFEAPLMLAAAALVALAVAARKKKDE